jgi:photosystem II stability/assembly factor-like uncharacterized protein
MASKMTWSLAVATLVLTGAGCFGGGSQATANTAGGTWRSPDGGQTWSEANTLLLAPDNGTIGVVDVLTIERDPRDASIMYLGTRGSGLMISLDGGASWSRPVESIVREGSVLAVEADPQNVCTLYVLKADRLIKTTTCGRTWEAERYLESQPKATLTAFAVDWYNSNILYLGNSDGALLQSVDGGATWARIFAFRQAVSTINVSNADSRVILAGTTRDSLFRSADGGLTWNSLEESFEKFRDADRVTGFSQNSDGTSMITMTEYGLFRSTDGGLTWLPLSLVSGAGDVHITAATVAPKNGQVIYYGTADSFVQSNNGGATWTVSENPTTRAISAIMVDDINPNQVQVGLKNIEK